MASPWRRSSAAWPSPWPRQALWRSPRTRSDPRRSNWPPPCRPCWWRRNGSRPPSCRVFMAVAAWAAARPFGNTAAIRAATAPRPSIGGNRRKARKPSFGKTNGKRRKVSGCGATDPPRWTISPAGRWSASRTGPICCYWPWHPCCCAAASMLDFTDRTPPPPAAAPP